MLSADLPTGTPYADIERTGWRGARCAKVRDARHNLAWAIPPVSSPTRAPTERPATAAAEARATVRRDMLVSTMCCTLPANATPQTVCHTHSK